MKDVINFSINHWAEISAVVLAIGARLFPTEKNYDIIHKIVKLLDIIIPNLKKGGGKHGIAKAIIFFALLSTCVNSYGQLNTTTRQIRFKTGVQYSTDTAETVANTGRIWYDFNTNRYRANFNGVNGFFGYSAAGNFWPVQGNADLSTVKLTQSGTNKVTFYTQNSTDAIQMKSSIDTTGFRFTAGPTGINFFNSQLNPALSITEGSFNLSNDAENEYQIISPGFNGYIRFQNNDVTHTDIKAGNIISSKLANNTVTFNTTANGLSGDSFFSYIDASNELLLFNSTGTFSTSLFGGELQFDDIVNSDDVTLNNSGINITGLATPYQINSDNGLDLQAPIITAGSIASQDSIHLEGKISILPFDYNSSLFSGVTSYNMTAGANVSTVDNCNNCLITKVITNGFASGAINVTPSAANTDTIWSTDLSALADGNFDDVEDATGTFSARDQTTGIMYSGKIEALGTGSNNTVVFIFHPATTNIYHVTFNFGFNTQP